MKQTQAKRIFNNGKRKQIWIANDQLLKNPNPALATNCHRMIISNLDVFMYSQFHDHSSRSITTSRSLVIITNSITNTIWKD